MASFWYFSVNFIFVQHLNQVFLAKKGHIYIKSSTPKDPYIQVQVEDPGSFEVFPDISSNISEITPSDYYAKDKWNVYFGDSVVAAADVWTFRPISASGYAKDTNYVYFQGEIVEGADPKYFRSVLPYRSSFFNYGMDLERVYVNGEVLQDASPKSFRLLKNGNVNHSLATDSKNFYCDKTLIESNGDTNFKMLSGGYWINRSKLVKGCEVKQSLDNVSFIYNYDEYIGIDNKVEFRGRQIERADTESFRSFEGLYSCDQYALYYGDKKSADKMEIYNRCMKEGIKLVNYRIDLDY